MASSCMKKKPLILIGIGLVPLLVVALGVGTARVSHRTVEVGLIEDRLRPCPSASNCVCSEPDSGAASVQPLSFEGDPKLVLRSLVDFLGSERGVKTVEVGDVYVHAVYYTPLLRFADDVEFGLSAQRRLNARRMDELRRVLVSE